MEKLLCDMPQADKGFDEPWELRAFAMAVAAYHEGHYEWSEFQLSLIDSIKQWEDGAGGEPWNYYEHWLNALETVLASNGALSDPMALDHRTREVLATPRNANHHRPRREPVAVLTGGALTTVPPLPSLPDRTSGTFGQDTARRAARSRGRAGARARATPGRPSGPRPGTARARVPCPARRAGTRSP